ncbi:MAG: HAD family hydrolase [Myxococcota bacterium]
MQPSRDRHQAPTNVRAVLWDMDGTLIDSERLHEDLEKRVMTELGVPFEPDVLEAHRGHPTRALFGALLERVGRADRLEEALQRRLDLVQDRVVERVVPVRGAEAALNDIPARTHRFALVTSNERVIAEGVLERFGWAWRFDVVVGVEDYDHPKPDPEPYRLACERLGVSPEHTLVVEDTPAGVASARAAGCRVAAVPHTVRPDRLQEADYVLSNLGAVVTLVHMLR